MTESELGPKLAEGKTKIIHAYPDDPSLAYMLHKDDITAGDGAKRDVLEDKGELSCRTTSACFRYLESAGIDTHYIATVGPRTMIVKRAEMVPIEWVARRIATGSYVRRTGTAEGTRFEPVVLEMFLKDDARHDPQITPEDAIRDGLCTPEEVQQALQTTEAVFLALEEAWAAQGIQLVDLKIEFGRTADGLLVADVIDNDSWRLWPGGRREHMLDKQVYRELEVPDAAAMADLKRRYAEVAQRTEAFVG
ncbi:MAG TPA: phosphoribosylaminoimidazolesuccinocarboxamide synthase [Chloroflexota bacterium]|nr:phosphoribosylaminoimidazolesuccinocarboxamide synthase [Chloroflexota bacterium]